LERREHIADRQIRQAISVIVDVETVDGVGMKLIGQWVRVEDDYGPHGVIGRLKRIEIAQVESLIAERRAQTKPRKMVRHVFSFAMSGKRSSVE
jgi:hypothetical protein